jgi:exodeoxyribonuclease VII large subunit
MPNIPLVIYHSAVQGSDASMQLVRAIRTANQRREVDVLIICRGGGSMEDLWCFNEEVVAREVFASQIPIISAVGHETDTTIIDFVSDLRAPTPTAAAELVAKSRQEWLSIIERLNFNLNNQLSSYLNERQQRLDLAYAHLKASNPLTKLANQRQNIMQLQDKLRLAMNNRVAKLSWQVDLYKSKLFASKPDVAPESKRLEQFQQRLQRALLISCQDNWRKVSNLQQQLELLNPDKVLQRGFAIIQDSNGKLIQSVKQTKHHAKVSLILADGKVSAIIDKQSSPEQGELI